MFSTIRSTIIETVCYYSIVDKEGFLNFIMSYFLAVTLICVIYLFLREKENIGFTLKFTLPIK